MQKEIRTHAQETHVPILREKSCEVLSDYCKNLKPKNILEIGTAIGYSGMLMLEASEKSNLTTVELNEQRFKEAEINFKNAGFEKRVVVINGDANEVIKELTIQGQKYDFIFLDGPKGQYIKYLPYLKKLLYRGGVLFADNIYFRGLVKSEGKIAHKHRTIVNNLRQFIDAITHDDDFDTKLLDVEDGISISKLN